MATIKEICEALDVKYDKHHTDRTLSNLQKDYYIVKNGLKAHDYTYVRPLTKEEKIGLTKANDCKKLLKEMLCLKLSTVQGNTMKYDMKDFLLETGLINDKYNAFGENKRLEAKNKVLDSWGITGDYAREYQIAISDSFHDASYPLLNAFMKTAFKELEQELLIHTKKILKCVMVDNGYWSSREMTPNEIEKYMKLTRDMVKTLPYAPKKWEDVRYVDKGKIMSKACEDMGFIRVYNAYELVLNRDGIKEEASNLTMTELKQKLNNEVADKLLRSKARELFALDNEVRLDGIDKLILL